MKNSIGRPLMGAPMSITLTAEQRLWLYAEADSTGVTQSEIVRRLLVKAMATKPTLLNRFSSFDCPWLTTRGFLF